ncbi:protein translocase subunit SecF [Clavibacter michiganensis subsp. phaseoli]|uniref:Protein-export membrane protein SecF n=1 Tax=Clavibacter phaseoli TaxID=1734031 RepID=A0A8I0VCV6_9MICO|nr:protein translocase subunit SecF [Clavibacter phaseoli]MBF4631877.1 protein translocase subunit SecF [Clavibacter phaseoli]MCJ1711309.1 protein translocase subunit SecF [Clavibacter phaseoli]
MAGFSEFGNDLYTGKRSFDIVGRRRLWYSIAAICILVSVLGPLLRGGFTFGIEFTGGSEYTVSGVQSQSQDIASEAVATVTPVPARVSSVGSDGVRVQTDQLEPADSSAVRQALATAYGVETSSVTESFIGPSWGQDITRQALWGLVVFLALAAVVMSVYFRTWKMSVAAIIALLHDLVLTAGIYGITGFEVTPAAVIGFLTILGYSLYDTVVVFDKIRENTAEDGQESRRTFGQSVNLAVNQTLVRSINTSIVAILPVGSILFIGAVVLGAGTLRDIALSLFIGIIVGTYSTIFIAAPLYAHLREGEPKVKRGDSLAAAAASRAQAERAAVAVES